MSNDDGRSAIGPRHSPREFVHDLRNCLGIAVGTACSCRASPTDHTPLISRIFARRAFGRDGPQSMGRSHPATLGLIATWACAA
jgi:hypothetical protein